MDLRDEIEGYETNMPPLAKQYFDNLLLSSQIVDIVNGISELIFNDFHNNSFRGWKFLVDMLLFLPMEQKMEVMELIDKERLSQKLARVLADGVLDERLQSLYFVGRIPQLDCCSFVGHAFKKRWQQDPILIPSLLDSLQRLRSFQLGTYWIVIATASKPLFRWIASDTAHIALSNMSAELIQSVWSQLEVLCSDANPYVRTEAEFSRNQIREAGQRNAKNDGEDLKTILEKHAALDQKKSPIRLISNEINAFQNWMHKNKMKDYKIQDFENFLK